MAVESTRPVLNTLGDPRAEARVGPADAKASELAVGADIEIEDLQGCQVSDFLTFHRGRPESASRRRSLARSWTASFRRPASASTTGRGMPFWSWSRTQSAGTTLRDRVQPPDLAALGYPDHVNCTDSSTASSPPSATRRAASGSPSTSSTTRNRAGRAPHRHRARSMEGRGLVLSARSRISSCS